MKPNNGDYQAWGGGWGVKRSRDKIPVVTKKM